MKRIFGGFVAVIFCVAALTGCSTKGGTGAIVGGGLGALAGNLIGSNVAGTLIGAGVGAGVGYLIGNEMDKDKAKKMQQVSEDELKPLSGTAWQVIKISPQPKEPVVSTVVRFNPDGTAVTTKTHEDGKIEKTTEKYRIVGDTLIFNNDGYIVNDKFSLSDATLEIFAEKHSITLQKI
ncbi:MAG: glycine zipper domain-containing protein [Candidatus Omnitrophica bacterium]|nr:glycine zipper domain-containing protein [Candidatus Omnitrophota bacterium]